MAIGDKEEYRRAGQMPTEKERNEALKISRGARTRHELARVFGVTFNKHLVYYLYRLPIERRYVSFTVNKRTGGTRIISSPATGLKTAQRRLSRNIRTQKGSSWLCNWQRHYHECRSARSTKSCAKYRSRRFFCLHKFWTRPWAIFGRTVQASHSHRNLVGTDLLP